MAAAEWQSGQALVGLLGSILGLPGRATGGPVSPGRGYLVGERGPELFVPTSAGRVETGRAGRRSRDVRVDDHDRRPARHQRAAGPATLQPPGRQRGAPRAERILRRNTIMAFWLAAKREGQDSDWIQRFDPRFWTVNFPRPMMAALTCTAPDALRVDATFLREGDLAGIIWDSVDSLDHPLLAYATDRDYSHTRLSFRWRSGGVIALDAVNGPALTIEGRDAAGTAAHLVCPAVELCRRDRRPMRRSS